MNLADLKLPFPATDIEWRIGRSGVKGDGVPWAMVLAYVTNRAIMDRLDEVCGPENWRNEFQKAPDGGVMCGLSIRVNGEWITKWDGAENTDIEAVKGGLSGAMKRAGVQWGIGRYLYDLDEGFANIHKEGKHRAKTKGKDGKDIYFRWDAPAMPTWALPKPPAERITDAQKRHLEAEIGLAAKTEGLDAKALREKVKAGCKARCGAEHFTELTPTQCEYTLQTIMPLAVSLMKTAKEEQKHEVQS